MTKEAMKQALEALEAHADIGIKSDKAITSLRQAIAEAEKQEQDEPVADHFDCGTYVGSHIGKEIKHSIGDDLPAQKPWVGLTDEERNHARQTVTYSQLAMTASEWTEAVQIETERRLKEKNA